MKPKRARKPFLLKGTTGFVGGMHISAPYDCNGMVFVEDGDWWKRVKKPGKRTVITCHCGKPAVQLDHLWPYYNERTLCGKCEPIEEE